MASEGDLPSRSERVRNAVDPSKSSSSKTKTKDSSDKKESGDKERRRRHDSENNDVVVNEDDERKERARHKEDKKRSEGKSEDRDKADRSSHKEKKEKATSKDDGKKREETDERHKLTDRKESRSTAVDRDGERSRDRKADSNSNNKHGDGAKDDDDDDARREEKQRRAEERQRRKERERLAEEGEKGGKKEARGSTREHVDGEKQERKHRTAEEKEAEKEAKREGKSDSKDREKKRDKERDRDKDKDREERRRDETEEERRLRKEKKRREKEKEEGRKEATDDAEIRKKKSLAPEPERDSKKREKDTDKTKRSSKSKEAKGVAPLSVVQSSPKPPASPVLQEEDMPDFSLDEFECSSDDDTPATKKPAEPPMIATQNPEVVGNFLRGPPSLAKETSLEVQKIVQAMHEENMRARPHTQHASRRPVMQEQSTTSEVTIETDENITPPEKVSLSPEFTPLVFSKKPSQAHQSQAARRRKDLSKLVELQKVSFNIFEMQPMTEYDLYIRRFGSNTARQAGCQSGEDCGSLGVQTEPITWRECWTQAPPSDVKDCGVVHQTGVSDDDQLLSLDTSILGQACQDATRSFVDFVKKSGSLCLSLLDEKAWREKSFNKSSTPMLSCSQACTRLSSAAPFLAGRSVTSMDFSKDNSSLLLTAYSSVPHIVRTNDHTRQKGYVCLWSAFQPLVPQKILVCESDIAVCRFGPNGVHIVVGGAVDGTIVIWDLREPCTQQKTVTSGPVTFTLRYPSFTSAGMANNHTSAVVALQSMSSVQEGKGEQFSSFQIASMESDGVMNIWTVVELVKGETSGSTLDLGLSPGARVKAVLSATAHADQTTLGLRITCMAFAPNTPNEFFLGTNSSSVLHATRFGKGATPRWYRPSSASSIGYASDVVSVHVSPFSPEYFLMGLEQGDIYLFKTSLATPLARWEATTSMLSTPSSLTSMSHLCWSPERPCVFFSVSGNSLLIWDLLENDTLPVLSEQLGSRRTSGGDLKPIAPTSFGVSADAMSVCFSNGSIEHHLLRDRFTKKQPNELQLFEAHCAALF